MKKIVLRRHIHRFQAYHRKVSLPRRRKSRTEKKEKKKRKGKVSDLENLKQKNLRNENLKTELIYQISYDELDYIIISKNYFGIKDKIIPRTLRRF